MAATGQHTYQVLTKRSGRLLRFARQHYAGGRWPRNVRIGVSVEDRKRMARIRHLRHVAGAPVRFLSLEPLLEDLGDLPLDGIDWVIAGGESGPGARPMEADRVRSIRDRCAAAQVPFFFKQCGPYRRDDDDKDLASKDALEVLTLRAPMVRLGSAGAETRTVVSGSALPESIGLPCRTGVVIGLATDGQPGAVSRSPDAGGRRRALPATITPAVAGRADEDGARSPPIASRRAATGPIGRRRLRGPRAIGPGTARGARARS